MPGEWWENFFSGMALDLWRQAVTEEQTRAEADFIEALLELPRRARILDAPCGEGRLARALAQRGYVVTGVDIAQPFLEEARSKAAAQGLIITWEHRDMRTLPWEAEFDGAFCFGNSFGYFTDAGNASFLRAIARALKPGARFVLDAPCNAESILPKFQERSRAQVGDILFLEENRYDHVQGRYDTDYTFIREGKIEKKFGSHRLYTYREICSMLEAVGLGDPAAFGSLRKEPFQLGASGLYLLSTRRP
jgi:SAM-dependent methyltransferase